MEYDENFIRRSGHSTSLDDVADPFFSTSRLLTYACVRVISLQSQVLFCQRQRTQLHYRPTNLCSNMDKLKKLFKHDSSDAHQESAAATHTQTVPSTTTSAQAPQTSNAGVPEKLSGVLMTTNFGDITIVLYSDKVPKVCALLQIPSNPTEKPCRLARTSPALRMQANTTMW